MGVGPMTDSDEFQRMDARLLNLLPLASSEGGEHAGPGYFGLVFYVAFVLALMAIVIGVARRGFKERVFKNPFSQAAEQMYLFVESMCLNIIGPHGRKYITFIGTLWMVIFVGNTVALFFPTSPTADISFNLAMALIAVGYVQYEGIKGHADHLRHSGKDPFTAWFLGFFRHLRHFAGPKMGGKGIIEIAVAVVMPILLFPIELISEMMKNISLSLRLYGNMHGGHAAVEALNEVGKPYYLPLGGFLLMVKLLTVVVQALVFTLLTCVYISLVTHHDEGHDEAHVPAAAH
jgi:F-type H+-transporting ATPase subunit a